MIINTLKVNNKVTFEELRRLWIEDDVADGKHLPRSTFNRHRDAIQKMFGIVIECDMNTYEYYIGNPTALSDDSIERWLYSTIAVHGMLSESPAVKDRVVLENVATGLEYLQTIIGAINTNHCLQMGYQKFGTEGYEKTVCPYALKLFHQRWYMLAKTQEDTMRIYALDRIQSLTQTEETFKMPKDFSPQGYFAEYFGVLTDSSVPMAHVVIRAHNWTPNYLRTLPLHHSQREL
ncbi:MAG: WYL domain-containing protein, partial [Prevotellaceae bacterium]|nr:WYL domain-containing protein [Prevotellaceae bacterium]